MNIDYAVFFALSIVSVIMMCFLASYKKPSEENKLIAYKAVRTTMVSFAQVILYFLVISITGPIQNVKHPIARGVYLALLALTACKGSMYIFAGFFDNLFQLKGRSSQKSGWFWLILFDLFVLLLIAGSFLNYAVLILFPDGFSYSGDSINNRYLVGFECIHYTFALITTSGSPELAVCHPITKVLEMVEMLVFYLVYGCWLTNLMSNDES